MNRHNTRKPKPKAQNRQVRKLMVDNAAETHLFSCILISNLCIVRFHPFCCFARSLHKTTQWEQINSEQEKKQQQTSSRALVFSSLIFCCSATLAVRASKSAFAYTITKVWSLTHTPQQTVQDREWMTALQANKNLWAQNSQTDRCITPKAQNEQRQAKHSYGGIWVNKQSISVTAKTTGRQHNANTQLVEQNQIKAQHTASKAVCFSLNCFARSSVCALFALTADAFCSSAAISSLCVLAKSLSRASIVFSRSLKFLLRSSNTRSLAVSSLVLLWVALSASASLASLWRKQHDHRHRTCHTNERKNSTNVMEQAQTSETNIILPMFEHEKINTAETTPKIMVDNARKHNHQAYRQTTKTLNKTQTQEKKPNVMEQNTHLFQFCICFLERCFSFVRFA